MVIWPAWTIVVGAISVLEVGALSYNKDVASNELSGSFMKPTMLRDKRDLASQSRIVGGNDADIGKYPFFVEWDLCGASLIHKDIILSAAHCDEISSNTVYVGSSRRLAADEAGGRGQQRSITQRITHPSYNAITTDFDYLIMKLDLPVDTQPALLNENPNIPNEAEVLTVIGYGATVEGGSGSSTLQEVAVNYIPAEKCNIDYNGHINGATMMCAGVGGGKDSCQGDSGGPIVIEAGDTFIQVGIVSWGEGCARPDFPGVYSRVSGQIEWIKAQICKLSDEPPDYCKMASIGPAASPTGSVSSPPTASGTAAPAPSPSTISPTISSPSASASLSSAPVGASPTAEICVDTASTFTVDDIHQQKDCAWLAENKSKFGYLCQFVDVAAACKKTCNVCDFFYPSSLVQSSARLGSGLFGKFAGKVVGGVASEVGSQMSSSDSQTSSSNSTTSSSDSNAGKIVGPIIAFLVILCIVCICRRARKPES